MSDFNFQNCGSICLLTPVSEAAKAWRAEHLPEPGDDCQEWGSKRAVAIEPRYAGAILEGIAADGLTVN